MNNIRVGIADDHNLLRDGVRMLLEAMDGIELCLEAADGEMLLKFLETIELDVLLLDIEMENKNGIEAIQEINEKWPEIKVIVLSMHTEPRMISYMMELGARGYLKKDVKAEELERVIHAVNENGIYLDQNVASSLLQRVKTGNRSGLVNTTLSSREKEVLKLICEEYTTPEIGEKLFISNRTVEGHRQNLLSKLGVKNVAGLVRKAIELQLVDL